MDTSLTTVIVSIVVALGLLAVPQIMAALAVRSDSKYSEWVARIRDYVYAAEQLMSDGSGEEKLEFVLSKIQAHLPGLDSERARLIIESIVNQMNREKTDGQG